MPDSDVSAALAAKVRQALDSADVSAFADLLDPNVSWGPPDDAVSGCHNRGEVVAWYERARAEGMRGTVTEVAIGAEALLVGMCVTGRGDGDGAGVGDGEGPAVAANRWQVLRLRQGRIVDIRGFDDRAEAAARAGVA